MTELEGLRARCAELQRLIEEAPDEATARPLAAELQALMDDLDNVRELREGET